MQATWHGENNSDGEPNRIQSRYEKGNGLLNWTYGTNQINDDTNATILGYIVPARTEPLGQEVVVNEIINRSAWLLSSYGVDYTNSNQDHSAQFYNSYAIRKPYWQ